MVACPQKGDGVVPTARRLWLSLFQADIGMLKKTADFYFVISCVVLGVELVVKFRISFARVFSFCVIHHSFLKIGKRNPLYSCLLFSLLNQEIFGFEDTH